ncbi:GMP synthase (glutamine-hydrolysing) [Sphingomonas sp. PP-CE-1A-559]|uniref:type 1 glutamine amidotransferase n=1 Tax=Sphingomonas sp. PP-CE-1A-559 TaxID=2135657 RepID=UPI0010567620|nr:type 1 glutamine amidotransferase [Sphingomonas sp. PP-CE-1A-559]TCP91480.1 GMP synthase (glutamine-hydrolysing) [Sphingomonas sp. PP-CE-1A-559]
MPHFLVAESETADEREARRRHAGKSSGETYASTLRQLRPDAEITIVAPADDDAQVYAPDALGLFDAVFITGSPLHVYDDSPEVRRQLTFMRSVFASGTPSFGSCAGLQLAVAAAGGKVRKMPQRMEAGIARRITPTHAGRDHPLLAGRAASWDAPAIHGDEVETLPDDATLLASNAVTTIQAAEIRHDGGIFWGVQYHPELALGEIAVALRRQAEDIVEAGLAETTGDVEHRADQLDALHHDPDRRSLLWALGVDREFADEARRRTELTNFLDHLADIDASDRAHAASPDLCPA